MNFPFPKKVLLKSIGHTSTVLGFCCSLVVSISVSVRLLQPATEHTSAMWVEPTTWRLDAPGRTDYPSCATSTLPQAGRTLGTWCRWVCDWVSPWCLNPEPQCVSAVQIHYCLFVAKTLNTEERWPEGHVSISLRAVCQRAVTRSCTRVMKVRDRVDRVLVVFLSPVGGLNWYDRISGHGVPSVLLTFRYLLIFALRHQQFGWERGRECTYERNSEASSYNIHNCSGKAMSITQTESVYVCVCSLGYQACSAYAPYCHLCSAPLYNIFPHYLTKGTIF